MIAEDGVLADTKLIAEAMDAVVCIRWGCSVPAGAGRSERALPRRPCAASGAAIWEWRANWPAPVRQRRLYEHTGGKPHIPSTSITCHDGSRSGTSSAQPQAQ